MKAIALLFVTFAVVGTLHAQSVPFGVNPAEPSTLETGGSCASGCETVYEDCRSQCGDETLRARDEDLDLAGRVRGNCLERCKSGLTLCRESCGETSAE